MKKIFLLMPALLLACPVFADAVLDGLTAVESQLVIWIYFALGVTAGLVIVALWFYVLPIFVGKIKKGLGR